MTYHAFDSTGYVASVEPNTRRSRVYHPWILYWQSGRSFETFIHLTSAKAFVERLRYTREITWIVGTARAFGKFNQG